MARLNSSMRKENLQAVAKGEMKPHRAPHVGEAELFAAIKCELRNAFGWGSLSGPQRNRLEHEARVLANSFTIALAYRDGTLRPKGSPREAG